MPVTTLAEALPHVAWMVLFAIAAGAFAFAVLTAELTDATPGYLRFTALTAGVFALVALTSDTALPVATSLATRSAPPELELLRRAGLVALALLTVAYAFSVSQPRSRRGAAVAGTVAILATLLAAAVGWAQSAPDAVPLAVQLGILAAAAGGSTAAVALGHWYLVTPKISVAPLVLQARLLLGVLVVQGLLFVVWGTLGGGPGQGAWEALVGPSALLVWLRGLVTVAFPIVLSFMALRTAQTRSMESATGLLYINLAAVLAGTIGAGALYVSSGILA